MPFSQYICTNKVKKWLNKFNSNIVGSVSKKHWFTQLFSRLPGNYTCDSRMGTALNNGFENKGAGKLRFDNVFIVTYGRSGSTLLQGILNSIDGCLVRGENHNFVYQTFKTYKAIVMAKEKKAMDTPQRAWFGSHLLDDDYFVRVTKDLVKKLLLADQSDNPEITCFGFKEIRYLSIVDDLFDYLDFLSLLFPNSAFIFNFRNNADVVKSGWWQNVDREKLIKELESFESCCMCYLNNHPKRCFRVHYEDVVNKTPVLKDLFNFLGAKYNDDKITSILTQPHGYATQKSDSKGAVQ